ncbi:hypothetical protein BaRGS_00008486 [Batillaria attramentaria]|uniref:RRM domain-containing protein n=1 Tax=Batillaria attramentaria TaxID=370345 RepID=A0ABD0LM47_9CAEN
MMRRPPMPPGPMPPGPPSVSNVTNSNDPASKNSRVFVGNLNTFVLAKEDVDAIFHRYGMVTGISMHKGYAFVQFNHPAEARRAVSFEDGQMYAGQPLDLNIVSEPKHRPAQKRPPPQNDRRPPMRPSSSPSMPPVKRPRQETTGNASLQRTLVTLSSNRVAPTPPVRRPIQSAASRTAAAAVKRATATVTKAAVNSTAAKSSGASLPTTDILICGVCKMQFTSLHSLAQHKKVPCRLKASCQCQTNPPQKKEQEQDPLQLDCATCDARFDSAWALCQHCQTEHKLSIFKTEESASAAASNSNDVKVTEETKEEESEAAAEPASKDESNSTEKETTVATKTKTTTPAKK